MNEETMRKHYETTPKDILINILISARKEFDKLQNRNKERKQEIERLNNIINELEKDIKNLYTYGIKNNAEQRDYLLNRLKELQELKGSESNE